MSELEHGRSRYRYGCRCDVCREANIAYMRAYRLRTIERERARKREWKATHREQHRENNRRWKRAHPWRGHHLTNERYAAILAAQGGGCAGCGVTPEEYGRVLDVDHDHDCCPRTFSCGKCVRGIVCRACNLADVLAGRPAVA